MFFKGRGLGRYERGLDCALSHCVVRLGFLCLVNTGCSRCPADLLCGPVIIVDQHAVINVRFTISSGTNLEGSVVKCLGNEDALGEATVLHGLVFLLGSRTWEANMP